MKLDDNHLRRFSIVTAAIFVLLMIGGNALHAFQNVRPRGQGVVIVRNERGQLTPLYSGSYALLIGVSDYTGGWRDLPGVAQDIEAVSAALREDSFQITKVMNPTRASLTQAIEDFISQYGEQNDNRLLIYFAGHGETLTTPDGRQLGYIVPADAPPSRNQAAFKRTAISMQAVDNYAQQIVAKHVLFVFDSCFSGMLFDVLRRSGPPPVISLKATQPVRQFITAGTASQEVPDQSLFRQYFVRGLRGDADLNRDGYITGTELGDYLEAQVSNYSRNAQTPRHGKLRNPQLDQGDFIFASPVGQRVPITATYAAPPPMSVVTPPPAAPSGNLVINGDFSSHWSNGWQKLIDDPTVGSLTVEVTNQRMLHAVGRNKSVGQVFQKVALPQGRGIDGLMFEAEVKLFSKMGGVMFGFQQPVRAALFLELENSSGGNLGQIMFTNFSENPLHDTGLAGVPQPVQGTGKRCQINIGQQYSRLKVRVDEKAKDCLSRLDGRKVAVVEVGVIFITQESGAMAEAYLGNVKLYYQ